jgi:hypothetical protein
MGSEWRIDMDSALALLCGKEDITPCHTKIKVKEMNALNGGDKPYCKKCGFCIIFLAKSINDTV